MVHVLVKPGLENLGHYFTGVWDECSCAVVGTFFGIALLRDETCVCAKSLSRVRVPVTPWTVAHQAPLPMGLSRQEYWSGVPYPRPNPGIELAFLCLLPWQVGSLPPVPRGEPRCLRVEFQLPLGCVPGCSDGSVASSQFSHDLHWTVCCEDTILLVL